MKAEQIRHRRNDYEHVTNWRRYDKESHTVVFYPGALKIYCSECSNFEVVGLPHDKKYTCQQSVADQLFRNRGWQIGRNSKHCVCPICQKREAELRERRRLDRVFENLKEDLALAPPKKLTVVENKPKESEVSRSITAAAQALVEEWEKPVVEPPPEPTREERRIIFAKLQDVYVDEKVGYDNGWTDKRVAEDLSVPRAWVTKIRDENFGPEGSNEETREIVAKCEALLKEAATVRDDAQTALAGISERIDKLLKAVADLRKQY